ncbi:MAG TPA: DUF4149 domain-containing protein [Desulfurivibrionaceae bacterium]|nr:DUF4149 domain-containing protein [Desulfurivibrionaceae bacterium]
MQENTSRTTKIAAALYRLAVAAWWGGAALFTFVLTPTLFRSLNRDQAGAIVGYLFPGYFRWGLACGLIALAALALAKVKRQRLASSLLVAMLVITAGQAFLIEPRAAALKREIPSFETSAPDHPLRAKFRQLHGLSAAGNLAVIGGGVVLVLLL